MADFAAVNARLCAQSDTLLPQWLPYGKRHGREWRCGDISGAPGDSFAVNMDTGKYADFGEEGVRGGDLISLYGRIHTLTPIEALRALALPNELNGHAVMANPTTRPPQVTFIAGHFKHRLHGLPAEFYVYRDCDGPMHVAARYDKGSGKKEFCPWTWDGLRWQPKGPEKPRPLYGLDRLFQMPTKTVLLVEGEKTADAAQRFFPKRPCMTWMNGAAAVKTTDWSPLAGLSVDIWPDADDQGRGAAAAISERLMAAGCTVRVVKTDELPDKWDLADAEAEGWTATRVVEYARANMVKIEVPVAADASPQGQEPLADPPTSAQPALNQDFLPRNKLELWQAGGFMLKTNNTPYANQVNVGFALAHAKMPVFYDEFARRVMYGAREWNGQDTAMFTNQIQLEYGISDMKAYVVADGVDAYAFANRRNPPQEWMKSLIWDGVPRLNDMLHKGFGSIQDEYHAAVGRCFMTGLAARVLRPGCKVDSMPIFEGAQGAGKSTALRILGGEYFAEVHDSMATKDFYISITGKFLIEISELNSLRKADVERVKGVLTTAIDRFRSPYDKTATDHPRACVFAGTTNSNNWNADETGARRFWPVACGKIDRKWLRDNRDQLFAEAVNRYQAGEHWWDVPHEAATIQRHTRREVDEWEGLISAHLDAHEEVNISNILLNVLCLDARDVNPINSRRIGRILTDRNFKNEVRWNPQAKRAEKRWIKR